MHCFCNHTQVGIFRVPVPLPTRLPKTRRASSVPPPVGTGNTVLSNHMDATVPLSLTFPHGVYVNKARDENGREVITVQHHMFVTDRHLLLYNGPRIKRPTVIVIAYICVVTVLYKLTDRTSRINQVSADDPLVISIDSPPPVLDLRLRPKNDLRLVFLPAPTTCVVPFALSFGL